MKLLVCLAWDFQRPVEPHFPVQWTPCATHITIVVVNVHFKNTALLKVKVQILEKMRKTKCFRFHSGLFRKEAKNEMMLEPADGWLLVELISDFSCSKCICLIELIFCIWLIFYSPSPGSGNYCIMLICDNVSSHSLSTGMTNRVRHISVDFLNIWE